MMSAADHDPGQEHPDQAHRTDHIGRSIERRKIYQSIQFGGPPRAESFASLSVAFHNHFFQFGVPVISILRENFCPPDLGGTGKGVPASPFRRVNPVALACAK